MGLYEIFEEIVKKVIAGQCIKAIDYLYEIVDEAKESSRLTNCEVIDEAVKGFRGEHESHDINVYCMAFVAEVAKYNAKKKGKTTMISDKTLRYTELLLMSESIKSLEKEHRKKGHFELADNYGIMLQDVNNILKTERKSNGENFEQEICKEISVHTGKEYLKRKTMFLITTGIIMSGILHLGNNSKENRVTPHVIQVKEEKRREEEKSEVKIKKKYSKKDELNSLLYHFQLPSNKVIESIIERNPKEVALLLEGNLVNSLYNVERLMKKRSISTLDFEHVNLAMQVANRSAYNLAKYRSKGKIPVSIYDGLIGKKVKEYKELKYQTSDYIMKERDNRVRELSLYNQKIAREIVKVCEEKERKMDEKRFSPYDKMVLMNYAIDIQYKLEALKDMMSEQTEPKYINSQCHRLFYNAEFIYGKKDEDISNFINTINYDAINKLHGYCEKYGYKSPKKRLLKRYVE